MKVDGICCYWFDRVLLSILSISFGGLTEIGFTISFLHFYFSYCLAYLPPLYRLGWSLDRYPLCFRFATYTQKHSSLCF